MKIRRPFAAAVLAMSCVAPQAHAAPMTYSQLSNFAVVVSDLTPDDGVGPSFSFTSDTFNSVNYFFRKVWLGPEDASYYGFDQQEAMFGHGGTSTKVSANGYNLASEAGVENGSIFGYATFLQHFWLGANTKVTFSVDWSASSELTYPLFNYSSGYLSATLDGVSTGFSALRLTNQGQVNYGEKLTVAIESGATDVTGHIFGMADSSAFNTAAAPQSVAEPGTFGVMLGGLAALAALRRRRAR